jgi:hypothetical protein
MPIQSHLSIKISKIGGLKPKKEPLYLLRWDNMTPGLKRFLLLQVIRAIPEQSQKYLSVEDLSIIINQNTSSNKIQNKDGILKDQLKIFIENIIYYGFIDDSYSKGLILNAKIYDELQNVDKAIIGKGGGYEK